MKKILLLSIISTFALFLSQISEAAWMSTNSSCEFYNSETRNTREGTEAFSRPTGVNTLCLKQEINALDGMNIQRCAVADTGPRWYNSFAPADQRCYSDCSGTAGNCTNWQGCEITIPWGTGSYTYWEPYCSCTTYDRSCTLRNPGQLTLVGGSLNHPVIDKWASCNNGDRNPAGELKVYSLKSGAFMWDDAPPTCMPASAGVQYLSQFAGTYKNDIELAQTIQNIQANLSSYTGNLVDLTLGTNYNGNWTNHDVIPRSYCADQYSGCQDTNINTHSNILLHNRQASFSFEYLDKVNNSSYENPAPGNQCSSLMVVPTRVDRMCKYVMTLETIKNFTDVHAGLLSSGDTARIAAIRNSVAYGVFNPADTATLQRMYYFVIAKNRGYTDLTTFFENPANWDSPTGTNVATKLADLESRLGLSANQIYSIPVPGFPNTPFTRDNTTCSYQLNFGGGGTSQAITPLIDRIKPTVNITSQRTRDNYTGGIQTILNNETDFSTPGSYYAGDINFQINLTDKNTSTYAGNPPSRWTNYNGVSGISSYQIVIERIKTATGQVLSTPDVITNTVGDLSSIAGRAAILSQRRTDASLDSTPDSGAVTWNGTIRKTGTYRMIIRVSDFAGNRLRPDAPENDTIAYFTVVPNNTETTPCTVNCTVPPPPGPTDPITPRVPICPGGICIPTMPEDDVDQIRTGCETTYIPAICERNDLGVVTMQPQNPANTKLYADAQSTDVILLTFYDRYYNPMYNREVRSISQSGGISPYPTVTDNSPALITQMNDNGTSGSYTDNAGKTSDQGSMFIRTFSYTPGTYTLHYTGELCFWNSLDVTDCAFTRTYDANYADAGGSMTGEFLHIFTGAIALSGSVESKINLGSDNAIGLAYTPTQSPVPNNLQDVNLTTTEFMESLRSTAPKFALTQKGSYDQNSGPIFSPPFGRETNLSNFMPEQVSFEDQFSQSGGDLSIRTDPIATLTINGLAGMKTSRYYISPVADYYGSGLTYSEGRLNRIYIEGYKRSQGKEKYVTDKENIVNTVATKEYRNLVYKNVALLTRNRTVDTSFATARIINGVMWVRGDVILDDAALNRDWNTLIVEDGNIIVSANILNGTKKRIALVALSKNDATKGNLYIKPNVRFIAANIFVDGSAFSVSANDVPYMTSSTTRTSALQEQFVLYGNLFSKNTVGGAVRGDDGQYVLPVGISGSSPVTLDEAIRYDLSFLRMNNKGYDLSPYNGGHRESVIFLMNMDFFQDPLPVFSASLK